MPTPLLAHALALDLALSAAWDAVPAAAARNPAAESAGRSCPIRVPDMLRRAPSIPSGSAALRIRWADNPDSLPLVRDTATATRLADSNRVQLGRSPGATYPGWRARTRCAWQRSLADRHSIE